LTASQASCSAACERRIRAVQAAYRRCLRRIQVRPESLHQRMTLGTSSRFAGRSRPCCARRRICHALRGDRCWRGEIQDVREIVFKCCYSPAVGARPPGHGGGTRAIHPGRARHGGPATRRPAAARGPRRSAPHPRWCGGRARHGRVVTSAVRSPVRPATLWMRVVSMASARVIAGRMVVSQRASIDLPAPGGPSRRRLWSQRLHHISLHPSC
jgi:hypothetical protein